MAAKTRECPSCALDGPADEALCPYCGYEFPEPHSRFSVLTALAMAALMAWPLFELVKFLF